MCAHRIPFERALDFANKEKITELLYPLFVHNIGALLYHPANTHRTNAVMAAAQRRQQDSAAMQPQNRLQGRNPSELVPSSQPPPMHHHHPMQHSLLPTHPNLAPHPPQNQLTRPGLERSLSFPTPPSSSSSGLSVGNSDGQFWNGNMVSSVGGAGGQPLAIDTVMNSRSMPTTPATTPPGGTLQQLQQQYPAPPPLYPSGPPPMSQHSIAQQNMQRYGQPLSQSPQYMNQGREPSNMGPPTARGPPAPLSRPSSRQGSSGESHSKEDAVEEQGGLVPEEEHEGQDHGEEEAEHEEEYTHDPNYSNGHRAGNYYSSLPADHAPHMSPEMTGSPNHGGQGPSTPSRSPYHGSGGSVPRTVDGSGATPRTTTTPQQWAQPSGYSTPPPRSNSANGARQLPQRSIYQLTDGQDAAAGHNGPNGSATVDNGYPSQPGLAASDPPPAPQQPFTGVNGASTPGSNKRIREMDDEDEHGSRPSSRGPDDKSGDSEGGPGGLKRRKTVREGSTPSTGVMASGAFDRNADGRLNRTRSAVGASRTRR